MGAPGRELAAFFALACAITWALDAPAGVSWWTTGAPGPAIALAGLGAFGPTLAALVLGRRALGEIFGRWRVTHVGWLLAAPLVAAGLHTVANLIERGLGGTPAAWFHPPVTAEHWLAMVFFSVGEEFGWRGFAHPRAIARFGPVPGSLLVGGVWALWHWPMFLMQGLLSPRGFGLAALELVFASVLFGWFFERSGRSMAVAILFHAGAHLDNVGRAPAEEPRLAVLRLIVTVAFAALAARAWTRRP